MSKVALRPMPFLEHVFAYISLGLLCSWYHLVCFSMPALIISAIYYRYLPSIIVLVILVVLTYIPLKYEPWEAFMYSWVFRIWRDYFSYSYECHCPLEKGKRYMFFEYPHGLFPMGQFISASVIRDIYPNDMVCGIAADAVFVFPVIRHLMAWIGTRPANRKNITKIFEQGHQVAVLPGGIAEMYLVNPKTEGIYLRKRHNTVRAAIEEGANIVPVFFFGNSRILNPRGISGSNNILSRISRRIRASIVFFTGRNLLPVPFRHPIHFVIGEAIPVKQKTSPTAQEVEALLEKVIAATEKLYNEKKPEWEDKPLVIH